MVRPLRRRETIKGIGAVAGLGSIAGCTGLIPQDWLTFDAGPAFFESQEGNVPVSLNPTQIIIRDTVRKAGVEVDIEATSYAITQVVTPGLVDLEPETDLPNPPILGELFVFSTPTISVPGVGNLNPAKDITPRTLMESFGGSNAISLDSAAEEDRSLPQVTYDDLPAGKELLKSGYRGWVDGVTDTNLERGGERLVSGTASIELGWMSDPQSQESNTVDSVLVGSRIQHDSDFVFIGGWSPRSVVEQFGANGQPTEGVDDANPQQIGRLIQRQLWGQTGSRALQLSHPSTCPEAGCIDSLKSAFERVDLVFPTHRPEVELGDTVVDTEDTDPDPAIVVKLPDTPIDDWIVYGSETVAYQNPAYDPLERMVVVVFEHLLDDGWNSWDRADRGALYDGVVNRGIKFHAFPHARLETLS